LINGQSQVKANGHAQYKRCCQDSTKLHAVSGFRPALSL